MNAAEFTRRRTRIEANHIRSGQWRRRALKRLLREARAELVVMERRVVGFRLQNGQVACVKHRYNSEGAAVLAMEQIHATSGTHVKPGRAYACQHCGGWHLTSQELRGVNFK